jgi:ectoine hydroxylase-related dioxygenase (phytanoyl-CoA dioxygenase family)
MHITEQQINDFRRNGYIVVPRILPPTLISDLRKEADKATTLAREKRGADAQRLQPVGQYAEQLNLKVFQDYAELPGLNAVIHQLLSAEHSYGRQDVLGILLEPAEHPWSCGWHRDMTLESSRLPADQFRALIWDWNSGNQVNCPLYKDECTWFVSGSHLRIEDLPEETAAASAKMRDGIGADSSITDLVEKERVCLDYTRSMPGAVQLRLEPGDFCIYRPVGWHIGTYLPYRRRATLHDVVLNPTFGAWWDAWRKGESPSWPPA